MERLLFKSIISVSGQNSLDTVVRKWEIVFQSSIMQHVPDCSEINIFISKACNARIVNVT